MVGWSNGVSEVNKKEIDDLMTKEMVLVVKMLLSLDVFNKKMSPSHIILLSKIQEGVIFHTLSFVWPNLTPQTTPLKLRPGTTGANIVRWQKSIPKRIIVEEHYVKEI